MGVIIYIILWRDYFNLLYGWQTLPDAKKLGITIELQKLVNEWPLDVIKHQKDEDGKVCF